MYELSTFSISIYGFLKVTKLVADDKNENNNTEHSLDLSHLFLNRLFANNNNSDLPRNVIILHLSNDTVSQHLSNCSNLCPSVFECAAM